MTRDELVDMTRTLTTEQETSLLPSREAAPGALVVLALVTQATGFGVAFHVLSIGLTSAGLALGTLTGVRVHNASREDAAIIVGMNRLRAAYVQMDPGIAEYLVTSNHDDQAGLMATYT